MSVKINIIRGEKDQEELVETIELDMKKSLNGDLMVFDHDLVDLVVSSEKSKITIFPKELVSEEVYNIQNTLLERLSKGGIVDPATIRAGSVFSSLEADIHKSTVKGVSSLQATLLEIYRFLQDEKENIESRKLFKNNLQNFFLDPEEEDSTELGEIPHDEKKGALDHQVRPYGYQYMYSILREMLEN
mgnify:CR=1 FL=1